MPLITDPDSLNQGTEVTITTGALTIALNVAGNLDNDGVTGQCLYSFLKEEWKNDPLLIPFPFPMVAITPEQFEWVEGWEPANDATRNLVRTAGWREIAPDNAVKREYMGIVSLGNIDPGDTAYYAFTSATSRTNFDFDGPVNQGIQTFGDATNGNFDVRSEALTVYVREQAQLYGVSTTASIGVTGGVNYITYRFPLSEAADLSITASDGVISSQLPYTGMTITYYATPQLLSVGGSSFNFGIVIDGNGGTAEQIYEFVQYQLRQDADIDAGAGTVNGLLADPLLQFVGSTLETLNATNPAGGGTGVYISNFDSNDTNRLVFRDNTDTARTFPFVAAGTINFSQTLTDDVEGIYRMFFTETNVTAVADLAISGATGDTASLDSAGSNLPTLVQNDYIRVTGAVNAENNGLWQITDATPTGLQADASKVDGFQPVNETAFAATVGEDPYGTADAILVDNNSGVDISGDVLGATSVSFDFDYDGNVQGGRTAATDADITIVAIGEATAQYVVATGTITRATGLAFTLVSPLERNFNNPV